MSNILLKNKLERKLSRLKLQLQEYSELNQKALSHLSLNEEQNGLFIHFLKSYITSNSEYITDLDYNTFKKFISDIDSTNGIINIINNKNERTLTFYAGHKIGYIEGQIFLIENILEDFCFCD